jgi:hypothetical protein
MKIPFVGPSSTVRSQNADDQRSVNVYLEYQKQGDGVSRPVALYGTPGQTLRATLASGATRGSIESSDYGYFVAGSHVFRISSAYVVVDCGAITTSSGRVGMATNGTEVLIVDGTAGWLVTGTVLTQIVDVDFPNGVKIAACLDSYFVVWGNGTQKFYWSETPGSGAAWNGLDFASVEGSPDELVGGVADHRQLWFVGTNSTEVYDNTGNADQLFQRSGNTFIEQGTASPWTVQSFDNSVVWLSRNKDGEAIFLKSQGGSPVRFSTHAVETALAGYSTLSDAFAYVYQMQGHTFYVVTFPTADATWMFDAATGEWFEWLWRDSGTNEFHRHRSNCHAFVGGKHLVGDWEDGKVYSLESDVYTDNGEAIRRLRRTQTTSDGGKPLFFSNLVIDMETGVANGDVADPQIMLRYSDDQGHSWSNEKTRSIGAVGEYSKIVQFGGSLGRTKKSKGRVWELSMTDAVKWCIFGADVQVTAGT